MPVHFLRSCREPALAELGHPDVASGRYDASALGLQTAQRDGTILATDDAVPFCMRLALLRQVVQQRGGQLRVMRQRRAVQVGHRRDQTHRRRQPHAVRLEQILRVERAEA